jgi:hypothetical protein
MPCLRLESKTHSRMSLIGGRGQATLDCEDLPAIVTGIGPALPTPVIAYQPRCVCWYQEMAGIWPTPNDFEALTRLKQIA